MHTQHQGSADFQCNDLMLSNKPGVTILDYLLISSCSPPLSKSSSAGNVNYEAASHSTLNCTNNVKI